MEDNFVESDDNFIGSKFHENTFKVVRRVKNRRAAVDIGSSGSKLPLFLETLNNVLAEVPPEFKDSVRIKLEIENDYDYEEAVLFVEFQVPETDEEVSLRLEQEERHNDLALEAAMKLLSKQGFKVTK